MRVEVPEGKVRRTAPIAQPVEVEAPVALAEASASVLPEPTVSLPLVKVSVVETAVIPDRLSVTPPALLRARPFTVAGRPLPVNWPVPGLL